MNVTFITPAARQTLWIFCLILTVSASSLRAQEASPLTSRLQRFLAIFQSPPSADTTGSLAEINQGPLPLTERYAGIYNIIHQEQNAYYQSLRDSSYTRWDEINQLTASKYVSPNGDTILLARNIKVFGWHPHWMGSAYKNYPFNLLSHVSLFSYNVNIGEGAPYDNPEVINGWADPQFDLITMAHAEKCKVMITVTNFGKKKNEIFLSDTARQNRLINDLVGRMVELNADGIDLDFELVPPNFEKRFSEFVRKLANRLALGNKRYELSVVLPKVNGTSKGNRIYNIDTLQHYVDFFTLTAYDFTNGKYSAGPISPLYNKDGKRRQYRSIEDVVFNYLEDGLDRSKLLLGLPYYGGKWSTYHRSSGQDSTSFEHLTYAAIQRQNRLNGPPTYDEDVWGAYYAKRTVPDDGPFTEVKEITWFDDSLTLSVKYDWILEQELGGVGLWALGYDQPRTDLWGLIDHKFAPVEDTIVRYEPAQKTFSISKELLNYRKPIGVSGLFVFLFLAIGFVVALFDWRVREVFYRHKTLRFFYIAGSFAIVMATIAVFLFLAPSMQNFQESRWTALLTLVIGLIVGALLFRQISKWFSNMREDRP